MQHLIALIRICSGGISLKNRGIEVGAKAIANDLQLPGGRRKKLARIVVEHLEWFDLAEARGMTWDDMIAVLAAAGVKREDGRPLSRGALSSAVWRKRQDGRIASVRRAGLPGEQAGESPTREASRRTEQGSPRRQAVGRGPGGQPAAKSPVRKNAPVADRPAASGVRGRQHDAPNAVLAYMQRAARIRRNADEMD